MNLKANKHTYTAREKHMKACWIQKTKPTTCLTSTKTCSWNFTIWKKPSVKLYGKPVHFLASHWIATIVIYLVLQSTPTHVNRVDEYSEVAPNLDILNRKCAGKFSSIIKTNLKILRSLFLNWLAFLFPTCIGIFLISPLKNQVVNKFTKYLVYLKRIEH